MDIVVENTPLLSLLPGRPPQTEVMLFSLLQLPEILQFPLAQVVSACCQGGQATASAVSRAVSFAESQETNSAEFTPSSPQLYASGFPGKWARKRKWPRPICQQ